MLLKYISKTNYKDTRAKKLYPPLYIIHVHVVDSILVLRLSIFSNQD